MSFDGDDDDPFGIGDDDDFEDDIPVAPPKASEPRKSSLGRTMPDFSFMFTGYHIFITEKNTLLFGHRYGAHLLDVHEYPCGDDIPQGYLRFLKDKIAERFIPRSDLTRPVPAHLEGKLLDISLMQQAFRDLGEE